MSNKIFRIKFNYDFALADIVESQNGVDSLELTPDKPELLKKFRFDWLTDESEMIPDVAIIMMRVIGGNEKASRLVKSVVPDIVLNPITIGNLSYVIFSNIPTRKNCLNMRKSKIKRYSTGDIMEISSPVFLPAEYPHIFMVEEMRFDYFCSSQFKEIIEGNCTGLLFEECAINAKTLF